MTDRTWLDDPEIRAAIASTVAKAPAPTEAQVDLLRRLRFPRSVRRQSEVA